MKLLIFLSLCIASIRTWWDVGHMVVAQIAEYELQKNYPKVYERANELVTAMGDLAEGNNMWISSATWPDQIKDKAMSFLEPWHYYDRPYNPQGLYLQQEEHGSYWNGPDCLERAKYELRHKPEVTNFQKVLFIRYVIHVIGDLHQPLHSTTMFNKTYPSPEGDYGGNAEKIITTTGEEMILHAYWDSGAHDFNLLDDPDFVYPVSFPLNAKQIKRIRDKGTQLMEEYPKEYFNDLANNLDTMAWTEESLNFSRNSTYPLVMKQKRITEEYHLNSVQVCRQRAALAGYRLAHYLVDVYGTEEERKNFKSNQEQIVEKNNKYYTINKKFLGK